MESRTKEADDLARVLLRSSFALLASSAIAGAALLVGGGKRTKKSYGPGVWRTIEPSEYETKAKFINDTSLTT